MVAGTNYLKFSIDGKAMFIMREHRFALMCWRNALKTKAISKDSTLFHIDKHPDFKFDCKNERKSKTLLDLSEVELDRFIQNDWLMITPSSLLMPCFLD